MYTRVQFVLTEDLHRRLRQAAQMRGVSMSQVVREALERALLEDAEARRARKRRLMQQLDELSPQLFEQTDLVHTAEDLNAMREERMNELVRTAFGH
ncbi:MAG TPA: ribbon-helix-helix protein, CopG family [Chloroflexi bacterium]|nr:ribbon-helix-helix protein, CopG family [Chloroflexota bacterium]